MKSPLQIWFVMKPKFEKVIIFLNIKNNTHATLLKLIKISVIDIRNSDLTNYQHLAHRKFLANHFFRVYPYLALQTVPNKLIKMYIKNFS